MKKLLSAIVVLVFALATVAFAQSNGSQSNSQPQKGQQGMSQQNAQTTSAGNQQMSGTVSKNGKSFTDSSNNKTYSVGNPNALSGHEGQPVGLIVHVDPDNNVIHIIQVEALPQ
jgi:Ni/Co efflux regulator RcnB